MDTDEALARALDEVLSLSGGDPRKAMDALNARVTAHANRDTSYEVSSPTTTRHPPRKVSSAVSTVSSPANESRSRGKVPLTVSTVTSPTTMTRSPVMVSSMVSTVTSPTITSHSPGMVSSTISTVTSPTTTSPLPGKVSPSVSTVSSLTSYSPAKVSSRGKIGPPPLQGSSPSKVSPALKKSKQTRSNTETNPAPPSDVTSVFRVSSPQSPQLPITYDNFTRQNWMELFPDPEDDVLYTYTPVTEYHLPPPEPQVEDHTPNTLPLVLAQIQHEESKLPLSDFVALKHAIEADPFYLGEPHHISVRNSRGPLHNRRMKKPSSGSPTPGKWFAVAKGSEVGVFLDWLVVSPLVTGKSCSNFKSFRIESEAYLWLQACLLRGTLELIN